MFTLLTIYHFYYRNVTKIPVEMQIIDFQVRLLDQVSVYLKFHDHPRYFQSTLH